MMDIVFLVHRATSFVWPFVLVFCLYDALKGTDNAKFPRLIWAGIALTMMTAIPYAYLFLNGV